MSTPGGHSFHKAEKHLGEWHDSIPGEVLAGSRAYARTLVAAAIPLTPHPADTTAGKVGHSAKVDVRDTTTGRAWIQTHAQYLARWAEGGTKAHTVEPRADRKRKAGLVRVRARMTVASPFAGKKSLAAFKRHARKERKLMAQGTQGVLHATKRGEEFYSKRTTNPGQSATRPMRKAILSTAHAQAEDYKKRINAAWARTHR